MRRSQLVKKLAEAFPHLPLPVIDAAVRTILNEIIDHVAQGQRVEIRKFGNFSSKVREAHIGRNPKTGESLQMDCKRLVRFKAGEHLLGRLNSSKTLDGP